MMPKVCEKADELFDVIDFGCDSAEFPFDLCVPPAKKNRWATIQAYSEDPTNAQLHTFTVNSGCVDFATIPTTIPSECLSHFFAPMLEGLVADAVQHRRICESFPIVRATLRRINSFSHHGPLKAMKCGDWFIVGNDNLFIAAQSNGRYGIACISLDDVFIVPAN